LALAGVPTYPRSRLIDDPESARDLVSDMAGRKVCLMRGHGIVAVGTDVPEAVLNAVRLERLAQFSWQLAIAGMSVDPIRTDDEEFFKRPYRKSMGEITGVSVGRDRGADVLWRWMSYVAEDEANRPPWPLDG
jgi:L-fuculose-phosphate aldolase